MITMMSRYAVFCAVVEHGSFTAAAAALNYSQSAVSQAVKAVEQEVGLTLVLRKKDDIELTSDGKKVYPYIQNICDAEMALAHKTFEMEQLQGSIVRIGTFPTMSCFWRRALKRRTQLTPLPDLTREIFSPRFRLRSTT